MVANTHDRRRQKLRQGSALMALMALAGCASLPVSGPTGHQVAMAQDGKAPSQLPFRLVSVDRMAALPGSAKGAALVANAALPQPTDLIGPGDVLDIQIYEAGVALFAGTRAGAVGSVSTGAAQAEHLPPARVDDQGDIFLPFVGKLRAGGHTAGELSGDDPALAQGDVARPAGDGECGALDHQ